MLLELVSNTADYEDILTALEEVHFQRAQDSNSPREPRTPSTHSCQLSVPPCASPGEPQRQLNPTYLHICIHVRLVRVRVQSIP